MKRLWRGREGLAVYRAVGELRAVIDTLVADPRRLEGCDRHDGGNDRLVRVDRFQTGLTRIPSFLDARTGRGAYVWSHALFGAGSPQTADPTVGHGRLSPWPEETPTPFQRHT